MIRLQSIFLGAISLLITASTYSAEPHVSANQTEGETTQVLPPGPEKALVERMCATCHDLNPVRQHRFTKMGWTQMVHDMVARGAFGTPSEIETVINYLTKHLPSQGADDPPQAAEDFFVAPRLAGPSRPVIPSSPNAPNRRPGGDWAAIKGDMAGRGYSPLKQINTDNVNQLELAWKYETAQNPEAAATNTQYTAHALSSQVTPLVVDGVMYLVTPYGRAAALEADTGQEIWSYTFTTKWGRPTLRSLAYWPADADTGVGPKIFFGTTGGFVVSIDAHTGKPADKFADNGVLNFRAGMVDEFPNAVYSLSSPPVFYKHIMITGSMNQEQPALGVYGDLRAWDARTGELIWTFRTIPPPGEPLHELWKGDSWKNRSGANAWGLLTVDTETGTVFAPIGTVSYDYYGGDRPGPNPYGNSLLALDAETGELKWHYQIVHHDVWDYDLAAAPTLIEVEKDGRQIPAVAQITKQGLLFIFNRETGKPIYPVEERPVPTDGVVEGEKLSPTQPFPVRPPLLARTSFDRSEISKITPEHQVYCEEMLEKGRQDLPAPAPGPDGFRLSQGLYTPRGYGGTLTFPTTLGGVNYHGLSYDPVLGYVFAAPMNMGEIFQYVHGEAIYEANGIWLFSFQAEVNKSSGDENRPPNIIRYYFGNMENGWLCTEGPWGELVAVDVNTGNIAWKRPIGELPELKAMGIDDMGTRVMGGTISTAGGVTFVGGTMDFKFRAVDSATGKELWVTDVGVAAHNLPLTYLGRDGKQYVAVLLAGGGFLRGPAIPPVVYAFSLPDKNIQ